MMQYESVLNKITPLFYKLLNYRNYFDESNSLMYYLFKLDLPKTLYYIDISGVKNINYYYFINLVYEDYYPFAEKIANPKMIMLATKNNRLFDYNIITLSELIINLVINGFSFENEYIFMKDVQRSINFSTLFRALVGRDLYEAIRISVK
ncbi:MAG: hypothetical protein RXR31_01900 [Thermoproteota archaeon]